MKSNHNKIATHLDQPKVYEFKIQGHVDSRWTDWFGDQFVAVQEDNYTFLTGVVADQAALHGILKKVRDLGVPLISVVPIGPEEMPTRIGDKQNQTYKHTSNEKRGK